MNSHIPVLLKEVIEILKPSKGIIVDGTLGLGGHTKEILKGSKVSVIGLDQDGEALELAKKNLENLLNRVTFVQENFSSLKKVSKSLGFYGKAKGILLDLGVSSMQLERAERGFSFQKEGPLDMRMDKRAKLTASEIINIWPKEEIISVLRELGEERFARRIVDAIVSERKKGRIKTTVELSELIKKSVPKKYAFSRIHPATRTFQALRIAVNDELSNLAKTLQDVSSILSPNGKIVVISFHSLEDRIVKEYFREQSKDLINPPYERIYEVERKAVVNLVNRKPISPSEEEIKENPRARSAKLRVVEKL